VVSRPVADGVPQTMSNIDNGPIGIGQLILKLLQFNENQTKRPENNSIDFWRSFVAEFFTEDAIFKYHVWSDKETRTFEMPTKVLPRFFKLNYDSGAREVVYLMDNPREYSIENHTYLINCTRARIVTTFDNVQVNTIGHLRVIFTRELKILSWEFEAHKHEEFFPRIVLENYISKHMNGATPTSSSPSTSSSPNGSNANGTASIPPSPANEYGMMPQIMRCYEIAEVIVSMEDLMDFSTLYGSSPMESLGDFSSQRTLIKSPMPTSPNIS